MNMQNKKLKYRSGFTVVELIVVIVVIGILAGISIVSYGAWHRSAIAAKVKSDLTSVISAMDSARTFNNVYPSSVPSTVVPSSGVSLAGGSSDSVSYCVDGTSTEDSTITYYVASETKSQGPLSGVCSTRPTMPAPGVPTNLAITAAVGTTVNLSWTASSNATTYNAQCASDAGFVMGIQTSSVNSPTVTATVSHLSPSSTYYCRVDAVNANSTSAWSAYATSTTSNAYGSLAVGTSMEGFWTAAPTGFLMEDGSVVSRTLYSALFAVIGTTYGAGDGSTTFNLPDSRGRTAVNKNTADAEFATIGQITGSKTEALTIAQIPSHTHVQDANNHGVSDPGHNHSQNSHAHDQNISALQGGSGIRSDYNSDGASAAYSANVPTDNAWPTNNSSTTGVTINSAVATNQYTGGSGGHNNIQPSIVDIAVIKYNPIDASATTLPAGTSINGYWSTAPADYLLEDGSAVSRTTYADLFAAIGTTYGAGDGSTTFNVPDSRGRASVNKSSADAEFNTMGEKYGTKTETITIATMPSHTHIQDAHSHGVSDPGHNHTQNPHAHGEEVAANSGPSIRSDWNSDGGSTIYPQGVTTDGAVGTNNPSGTGITLNAATATNQYTGGGGSHNNIQPSIVKLSAIKYKPEVIADQPIDPGTSIEGYWSTVPNGYLPQDGSAVSRTTYASLFNAIGTTFGAGDGSTTFNLPDSRGRLMVNKSPTDTQFNTLGQKYGEKTHTLTIAEMPSHTHIQNAHSHSINDPGHNHSQNGHTHGMNVTNPLAGYPGIRSDYDSDARGAYYSQGIGTGWTTATNNPSGTGIWINATTGTNQYTGGSGAHNEIQPSIVKLFAIKY